MDLCDAEASFNLRQKKFRRCEDIHRVDEHSVCFVVQYEKEYVSTCFTKIKVISILFNLIHLFIKKFHVYESKCGSNGR